MQMFDKYKRIPGKYTAKFMEIYKPAEWKNGFQKINYYEGNKIISDRINVFNGFSRGIFDAGYDPTGGYCLSKEGEQIFRSEGLEFYENYQTGEIRVVLNNMYRTPGHRMYKDVIISLSKNELEKYDNSLAEAVGDKITQLNELFGSSAKSLTGEDGCDGYDISAQQIFIKDSKIYQPIDDEKLYEIGNLDNLPKTVYLVRDKKQSNNYKPDDFLKGIEMLKGVGNNDYMIKQIRELLSKCIDNVQKEKSKNFIKVNYGNRKCEKLCSGREIPHNSFKYLECSDLCNNKSNNYIYNDTNNIYGNYLKQQNGIYNQYNMDYNNFNVRQNNLARQDNLANYGKNIMNFNPYDMNNENSKYSNYLANQRKGRNGSGIFFWEDN